MPPIHYGVVLQGGRWTVIGRHRRYGAFRSRAGAERAARELALQSGGRAVDLHIQAETGQLLPPERIQPHDAPTRNRARRLV